MSSFRPILPAGNVSGNDPSDRDPSAKKRDAELRQLKGKKCDGGRPSCRTCLLKKRRCVYDSEEGRSKVAALRSRIEVLEQRVGQAQSASQADTSRTQSEFLSKPDSVSSATSAEQLPSIIAQRFLPSISVTRQAVEGFFSGNGELFHVFTRAQVSVFMDSVWKDVDIGSQSWKADVCCLMAIAAVGTLYTDTTGDTDVSDAAYDISKAHLDSVLEMRPLDAVKICTLLCMYNVMSKAVASLAYAGEDPHYGSGLAHVDVPLNPLQALIIQSTHYKQPSDLNIDDASDISEVVQTEMVRITVLKFKILYMNRVHKDIDWAISAMAQDLEEWYDGLPQAMHLQQIYEQDLQPDVKRSIYLVHLIYLGTNILLFRRIAFQTTRSSKSQGVLPAPWQPSREQYLKQAEEASLAANGSARIIKIMMGENFVFRRFQSYTSCLVLLHTVLGKIALKSQSFGYEEDLENIRSCLGVLSFCGSIDHVAARFHETLLSIYNSLMNDHVNKPPTTHPDADTGYGQPFNVEGNAAGLGSGSQESARVDSSHYVDQSLKELSTDLLSLLCRPFGDPINRNESKEYLNIGYRTTPNPKEHPCVMEELDWDFEDSAPFQWDTTKLETSDDRITQLNGNFANPEDFGLLGGGLAGTAAPMQHRFMGSSTPNV
ncbi:hypothetical protein CHU98_g9955 [Xylaria longipes]|nr:hypothetical protein CHU98_g9955 [Xylaria longipes]